MKKIVTLTISIACCIFTNAQNVGIGTTTPQALLHIQGNADISQLVIDANATQSNLRPLIRLRNSAGNDLLHIHSDDATNIFLGWNAGRVNSPSGVNGRNNSFFGSRAGYSNTQGAGNTAVGSGSLLLNQSASYNTAIGYAALSSNTNGIENTATGTFALTSNGSGGYNAANGMKALENNTIGSYNSAFGYGALSSNVGGSNATALGYRAMFYSFNGAYLFTNENVAVGYEALRGSVDASVNSGLFNTALGYQSLLSTSYGINNTASGNRSLFANTTGSNNTANGVSSLYSNIAGTRATAVGCRAMVFSNNTTTPFTNACVALGFEALRGSFDPGANTGNQNTAIGYQTLYNISSGSDNTATGYQALYNNTSGTRNSANGFGTLFSNTSGSYNTALGYHALFSNTNSFNTGIGSLALKDNIGQDNTAIGNGALSNSTTGNRNTSVGSESFNDLPGSNNNTIIGTFAHIYGINSVVLGYNSYTNTNNLALLGSPTQTIVGGYGNWSNFSDSRFKTNVDENVKGLDFIMRLRPVTYHMNVRGIYNLWGLSPYGKGEDKMTVAMRTEMDNAISNKEAIRMSGFIAQEVEQAANKSGYDFDGVIKPAHDKDHYRLAYGEFVVPLVKAVQELVVINDEKDKKIADLETRLAALEKLLNK